MVTELAKEQADRGENPAVYFWRDKEGHEVDAVVESGATWHAIEIKAGRTVAGDFFDGLDAWRRQSPGATICPWLVYGGDTAQTRERGRVVPWAKIGKLLEAL